MNGDIPDGDGSDHVPDPSPETPGSPGRSEGDFTQPGDQDPEDDNSAFSAWGSDADPNDSTEDDSSEADSTDGDLSDRDLSDRDVSDGGMFDPRDVLGSDMGWDDLLGMEAAGDGEWRLPELDDSGHATGQQQPLAQLWGAAIGTGAVDPTGVEPAFFAGLDSPEFGGLSPDEPDLEWLAVSDVDVENWADPGLLADVDVAPTSIVDGVSGADVDGGTASVVSLWDRLSPGQEMPMTASGVPDVSAALDELAARAGDTPLRDVVDVARQLSGR